MKNKTILLHSGVFLMILSAQFFAGETVLPSDPIIETEKISKNIAENYEKTSKEVSKLTPIMDELNNSVKKVKQSAQRVIENPKNTNLQKKLYVGTLELSKAAQKGRPKIQKIQESLRRSQREMKLVISRGFLVEKEKIRNNKLRFEELKQDVENERNEIESAQRKGKLSKSENRDLYQYDQDLWWQLQGLKNTIDSSLELIVDLEEVQKQANDHYDSYEQFLWKVDAALRQTERLASKMEGPIIATKIMSHDAMKDFYKNMPEYTEVLDTVIDVPKSLASAQAAIRKAWSKNKKKDGQAQLHTDFEDFVSGSFKPAPEL